MVGLVFRHLYARRMDLSYVATFLERYLSNTNWASANLITDSREDSMVSTTLPL